MCASSTVKLSAKPTKDSYYVWIAALDAGIYAAKFEPLQGTFTDVKQVEGQRNGYFIAKHPKLNVIYLAERSHASSSIHSYQILSNGELKHVASLDGLPAGIVHISIDNQGRHIAAAYYKSSYVGVYTLSGNGLQVQVLAQHQHAGKSIHQRQKEPHPHWSGFSPNGAYVYFADLGTDHIWVYKINQMNRLVDLVQKAQAPAGSGPRHVSFNQKFELAYVSDELSARVSIYTVNENTGKLNYLSSTDTRPELNKEMWFNVSDIKLHPNGNFLYLVNRGFDQVSVFAVQPTSGLLTFVEHEPIRGSVSRHINFDHAGEWAFVLGKESNTLALFKIEQLSGKLVFSKPIYNIPTPMALVY